MPVLNSALGNRVSRAAFDIADSLHPSAPDERSPENLVAWRVGKIFIGALVDELVETPVPMRLNCPSCGALHIDEGEFETKPHHTHACQGCGMVWRPALVPTVGVQFLPGFRNAAPERKPPCTPGIDCPGDVPALIRPDCEGTTANDHPDGERADHVS